MIYVPAKDVDPDVSVCKAVPMGDNKDNGADECQYLIGATGPTEDDMDFDDINREDGIPTHKLMLMQ